MTPMEEAEFRRRIRGMTTEEKMIALEEMPRFLLNKEMTVRSMSDAIKQKDMENLIKKNYRPQVTEYLFKDL